MGKYMPVLKRKSKGLRRGQRKPSRMSRNLVPRTKFSSDIHYFKRMNAPTTITGAVGFNPYLGVKTFELNSLVAFGEFTALFDHFMITKVVTKITLRVSPDAQAAAGAYYPRLYWARDTDDSTIPSNINELRQFNTVKSTTLMPQRPVTIVTRPNILALSYATAIKSTYTPKWNQWIDCNDADTRYFGFKWAVDNFTNTNYILDVEDVYYLKFKNSR